tara:strand:- start:1329 stop:1559 length:231 start_codon:yes stop_codon:yes gene_type:complete
MKKVKNEESMELVDAPRPPQAITLSPVATYGRDNGTRRGIRRYIYNLGNYRRYLVPLSFYLARAQRESVVYHGRAH